MIQYETKNEIQKIIPKPTKESNYRFQNNSNYFLILLGIPSNSSDFCSYITKESDETKANTTINPSINFSFPRTSNSTPKLASKNINICILNIKSKTPNKSFKSKHYTNIKIKKKETKEEKKEKINKTNNITSIKNIPPHGEKKVNNVGNRIYKNHKNPLETNVVYKEKKKILESYSQNFDLNCMKKNPPKLPEVFYHKYNLHNFELNSKNSYEKLGRGTIPNIFFGHWMVECNKSNFGFGGKKFKKFVKSSATQRNNKKLLTIVYYAPL